MILPFESNYHLAIVLASFNTHMLRQFSTFNTNILQPYGEVVYKKQIKKCGVEKKVFVVTTT
jgi:hypothetical protein